MFLVPTLVFVKVMSPLLVVTPGGTASDIVTQLERWGVGRGALRAGRTKYCMDSIYMGH
jgi:hypothetical protein